MASIERHRSWKIINENKIHPYAKQPVGFKMMAHPTPPLLPKPGSIVYERAMFASKTLWVTPYNEEQRYPGGFYCYQSEPSENLAYPNGPRRPKMCAILTLFAGSTLVLLISHVLKTFPLCQSKHVVLCSSLSTFSLVIPVLIFLPVHVNPPRVLMQLKQHAVVKTIFRLIYCTLRTYKAFTSCLLEYYMHVYLNRIKLSCGRIT